MENEKKLEMNLLSFGEYKPLVKAWCEKHEMAYVMPEFKELFDEIRIMDEKPKGGGE